MKSVHRLQKIEYMDSEGSFSYALRGLDVRQISRHRMVLFSLWVLRL